MKKRMICCTSILKVRLRRKSGGLSTKDVEKRLSHGFFRATLLLGA